MFHFPFFLGGMAFYFLPTIIGAARHKSNLVGIFLVNFFLGWSIIGWIVALVWAVSTQPMDQMPPGPRAWTPQPAGPPPPPPPHGRFCPHCGSGNPSGGHFCASCGAALS